MKTETITKLLTRVHSATIGRSKDVRLSIEEANALVAEIAVLLAEREAVRELPKAAPAPTVMDGGTL
jgi:hypothetical protein